MVIGFHIHKYYRQPNRSWYCAECKHYMTRNHAYKLVGKMSICWNCGKQFILTEQSMIEDQPICNKCDSIQSGINYG